MGSAATRNRRLKRSRRRPKRKPRPPFYEAEAQAPAEDPYEQLEKLGKLHEQGILTDEEFAAAKAKLLA